MPLLVTFALAVMFGRIVTRLGVLKKDRHGDLTWGELIEVSFFAILVCTVVDLRSYLSTLLTLMWTYLFVPALHMLHVHLGILGA